MDEQLMLGLQNQHSVQLTHFVDVDVDVLLLCNGCSAIYAVQLAVLAVQYGLYTFARGFLGNTIAMIVCLYMYCLSLEQLLCPWDE